MADETPARDAGDEFPDLMVMDGSTTSTDDFGPSEWEQEPDTFEGGWTGGEN